MSSFEVFERIDRKVSGAKEIVILAIDFHDPEMIKFRATQDLKKGTMVEADGSKVMHEGKEVGDILLRRSSADVTLSHDYDIKYTGGYSLDGKTIYLDEHFPSILNVEGKQVDARKSIGLHHELPEKWMSDEKYEYPYAHETATGIERKYVESLGVTWQGYCHEVDRNLRQVYRRTLEKSPPSLDLAPYLYCRDQEALGEIRKSEPDDQ